MLKLDDFTVRHVFSRVKDDEGNPVYWRETVDEDAYIVVFPDGESWHTYLNPEQLYEPWEED